MEKVMSEQLAKKFIEALEKLESENDLETISSLFAEDSTIGNAVSPNSFRGVEGAREFWDSYRKTLGEVRSTFRNQIINDKSAALEWKTSGVGDNQIDYEGVTILETDGEKITRFHAYFNPHKLEQEVSGNLE
jgi:hypothetical protein